MHVQKMSRISKKICRRIWQGVKDHKEEILTLSLVVVPALLIQDTCFASNTEGAVGQTNFASDIQITALQKPVQLLEGTLTGPIPKVVGTIGMVTGAIGWGIGTEQQVVKYGTRVAGGTGLAVAAGSVMSDFFGAGSGCLF